MMKWLFWIGWVAAVAAFIVAHYEPMAVSISLALILALLALTQAPPEI